MDLLSGRTREHLVLMYSLAHSLKEEGCEENMHESRKSVQPDVHLFVDRKEFIEEINYLDVLIIKPGSRAGHSNTMGLDRLPECSNPDDTCDIRNVNSDTPGSSVQMMPDIQTEYNGRLNKQFKWNSKSSDTSSAYSGSDVMQSSTDDAENIVNDIPCNLVESQVDLADSDDEEGFAESTESSSVHDVVRECLEKEPQDRTDDDIEILLDHMQHFRAFANMTLATRHALCAVMVISVIEKAGTIVMKDGEVLDSWWVILNGQVAVKTDHDITYLQTGDSFGITPTMKKLCQPGTMYTTVDDCQFVDIAQGDYYQILHQGEENTKRHMENEQCVMVTEHREYDGGNVVIRATPEQLMQQLLEDHSVIDPTYVEDFLLTYRTFLQSPMLLANKLFQWFEDPTLRLNVTRIVLLWVNNHFDDFEMNADMSEFLENFENLLERKQMKGQLRLLILACASKARPRTVTLTRLTRDELLYFQILGGNEKKCGIFIMQVERGSKAFDAGLKRGDQILEVNGHSMLSISHSKAMEMLRKTTHLSITVKSNLLEFKEMLEITEKSSTLKRQDFASLNNKQRSSAPDLKGALASSTGERKHHKKDNKGLMMTIASSKPKIRKALYNLLPGHMNNSTSNSGSSLNHSDENLFIHLSRKSSTSSGYSSLDTGLSDHLSTSNPDLSPTQLGTEDKTFDFPEHVVKVFRSDQSFKYLLVHEHTTAKEVVRFSVREFGVTDSSSNFCLCEVTVESEDFIKQKRLPDSLQNLPDRLSLNGRYYLKNNLITESLVPDEVMGDMIKEAQFSLIQLSTLEVTSQLTLEDFKVFKEIQDVEYIDEIFHLKSKFGCPNLKRFEELINKEMFWVVTEICSETNIVRRMKVIKHFIKIARHCQDCKNFNSMFAIVSGLQHSSVSRLHNTWEKVPNKYRKMYEGMYALMDPSRNMSKYRNLLSSQFVQPPMLPFFPVVKKDLTFVDLGNDSVVEGLVNFEKLRMFAKEIRHICKMCSQQYDVSTMYMGTPSMYNNNSAIFGMATMKRTKTRRTSTVPNARKMFEEALMTRRIKSYLSNLPCIRDEEKLTELSNQCEPSAKRSESASNMSASFTNIVTEETKSISYNEPKFGSMVSIESNSSTGSIKSNPSAPLTMYETDSSHSSVSTSDNHQSQCSVTSTETYLQSLKLSTSIANYC